MRRFVVVAGPNGCGKSTLTRSLRFDYPILDPDQIARRGLSAIAAARETLLRLEKLLSSGHSCVLETTLSGQWHFSMIGLARQSGMMIELHFVCVDSVGIAKGRVSDRVAKGGHDIADAVQLRRFPKSLRNVPATARLCDATYIYDNSSGFNAPFGPACMIARKPLSVSLMDLSPAAWVSKLINEIVNG